MVLEALVFGHLTLMPSETQKMYKTMFLFPVNLNQVHPAKNEEESVVNTPRKLLRKAIIETIARMQKPTQTENKNVFKQKLVRS